MGKINDYKIVEAKTAAALTDEVKTLLNDGWHPLGGVSYVNKNGLVPPPADMEFYLQTMVRHEHAHAE